MEHLYAIAAEMIGVTTVISRRHKYRITYRITPMAVRSINSVIIHAVTAIDLLNHIHSVCVAGCAMAYWTAKTAGIHELNHRATEEPDIVRSIHLKAKQTVKPVATEPEENKILLALSIVLVFYSEPR